MSRTLSLDARRVEIERRIDTVLESAAGDYLEPARTVVEEPADRWYGQLTALAYNSVAETPDDPSALRAATALELLWGYCRLRERLLVQLGEPAADSASWESDAALLASDYLYTSAYSVLGSLEGDGREPCFEALASASETMIETFGTADVLSPPSAAASRSFVDGTAGALGRGAAVIGATLAGVDDRRRDRFATLGRGSSSARRGRLLASDATGTASPASDDPHLRQYARRRLDEARRALRGLQSTADIEPLRRFVEERVSETSTDSVLD